MPILLLEGKHDLTWGADKPQKFAECFPGARLILFEASAHSPFEDESDKFFAILRQFMSSLQERPQAVARWKQRIVARREEKRRSPEHLLLHSRWGQVSSVMIAQQYSAEWLPRLSDTGALLRLGFALYDTKRYRDALLVFRRLEELDDRGVALVWQGHMLDLLDRRAEALAVYQKALLLPVGMRHDQYGVVLNKAYVEQRIHTTFSPVRNRLAD